MSNKLEGYERILRDSGLTDEAVAYMGDDLLDLPVLERAGLSAAPADAAPEVRERCGLGQLRPAAAAARRGSSSSSCFVRSNVGTSVLQEYTPR